MVGVEAGYLLRVMFKGKHGDERDGLMGATMERLIPSLTRKYPS